MRREAEWSGRRAYRERVNERGGCKRPDGVSNTRFLDEDEISSHSGLGARAVGLGLGHSLGDRICTRAAT